MLLLLALPAEAVGFHFARAEIIGGVGRGSAGSVPEGGVGASLVSDVVNGWITFGSPAADGHVVRAWRLDSSFHGPVLGVLPPTFRAMVRPHDVRFAIPWLHAHIGGDANARKLVEADLSGHYLLNVPGFWNVDPRRAYVGPSAGLGLNGTWWDGWRDAPRGVVMTGKVTGQAGILAGITIRDTWYAQGRAVASLDLFGDHQSNVGVAAKTGVFLNRVGVPLGFEVRGELDRGNDTVTTLPATGWALRLGVFWKLTPPFQTRIEENLEHRRRNAAAAAARGVGG